MDHLHTEDEAADISSTGVLLTLDTVDRPFVVANLYHADADASYVVEVSNRDSDTDADWNELSNEDTTSTFRVQQTVPEQYVRIRCDGAAAADDTADVALEATK